MKICRGAGYSLLGALFASAGAHAADMADYMTVGLRVAALVTQERLASPPLPGLGRDSEHHFTPQVGYLTGKVSGDFGASEGLNIAGNGNYSGKPSGYGVGLSYRSPSIGRASLFAFGLYTHSSSNYYVDFNSQLTTPNLTIHNSATAGKSGALGVNVLLVGDTKTFFAMAAFGGVFYSRVHMEYDYDYDSPPAPGFDTHYHHAWDSDDYGPLTGLHATTRIGRFSVTALAMIVHDSSNRCVKLGDAAGNSYPCMATLDNSFSSISVSADYRGLSAGIYSQLNASIQSRDVTIKKYQVSYTLSL
ncbi:MAG: hypothetical protein JST16_14205 [Bdellovibrionales bacterium]|nr:hypothetical protein [Bdellovibrionales bacterium]